MASNWKKFTRRTCHSLHECCVCKKNITNGQQYYDGGYGQRMHVECFLSYVTAQSQGGSYGKKHDG